MKFDLHIHSSYSRDGTASPKEIVERCKALGLDGFAITDHNAIQGSLEAIELAKAHGLIAIRGVELSTVHGHIHSYGISELVPRGLSIQETIDKVHAAGGVVVATHPARFPSGIGLENASNSSFDAIEVLNGGSSRRGNMKALRLAGRLGKPVSAGSDAHRIDDIGKSYAVVDGVSTEAEFLDALTSGRTRTGGRSRSHMEGVFYSLEILFGWIRGSFRRL